MIYVSSVGSLSKTEQYALLYQQVQELLSAEKDLLANFSNFSSLLYHSLPDINWLGFYFLKDQNLVLGPFQGKPACTRIALGKGVCGSAALQKKTIIVQNVHQFKGHIACDAASASEIVIPLLEINGLWGVFDVDSPIFDRFDEIDQNGLEKMIQLLLSSIHPKDFEWMTTANK